MKDLAQETKHPNTLLLILIILVVVTGLTWILPAGEYDRELIDGRTVVISGTYNRTSNSPQGVFDFLMVPIKGFISASQIVGFIFIIGGAFELINRTKAIDAGIQRILWISEARPKLKVWIVPMVMVAFSMAGATFGMSEAVLIFILITIPLAISLGYDSIVGISMSFLASGVGFAAALTNPFTIGIAQGIAELPLFSGWEYRLFIWVLFTTVAILFVMNYIRRLQKNKEVSSVLEIDESRAMNFAEVELIYFDARRKLTLVLFILSLIVLVIGVNKLGWYINEIVALFFCVGLLAAIVNKFSVNKATGAFIEGASKMMMAALIVALSKGILVLATDGKIIDTLLFVVSNTIGDLPKAVSVQLIFIFQGVLNFFMPSGSGQAALTMPVMTPLSDIIGISRQTTVLAFQFGDGLFNMIIPTSGVTMGVLGIAQIPFKTWLKWVMPLILIFTAMAMILLMLPIVIFDWGPF